MSSPAQVPPHPHKRRSFAGPVVLIVIGTCLLLANMGVLHWERLGYYFAHYWPVLIILWGIIKLVEHQQAQRDGVRAPGIGAGGVFLLIVLIFFGLAATQAARFNWGAIRDNIDIDDQDMAWFGHTYSYEDQMEQAFAPGDTLRVVNERGAVNINSSDDNKIKVVVHKRIVTDEQADADKYNVATKPQINSSDHTISLNANTQGSGDHHVMADLDISVPRKASVVITARHGDVAVLGRDGNLEISAPRGDVAVSDVNGKVSVNIEHGSVRVAQVTAEVSVEGRGDDVSIEDTKSSARVTGEFDSIKLARVGGAVDFKSARTDMEFMQLNGDLDMDHGDLRASDVVGPFRLTTRSKDIRIDGLSGDVRLQDENGAVELHMKKLGSMQVSNRRGDIQIYVPEKASFQMDARAHGGEIESDFSELKTSGANDNGTLTGMVGAGGPHLVLENEHGTIEIRKGTALAMTPPSLPAPPAGSKTPRLPAKPVEPTEN